MVIQVALRNEANESASVLYDSIIRAYNESIQGYNPALKKYLGRYGQSDGMLTGSSPLMQVNLQDSGLLPEDARIITRSELETAIPRSDQFLRGVYTDFGIALLTPGDSYTPNDLPAKILAEQLEHRGINLGKGKLINLVALSLQEDQNSKYGAVFRLNDGANEDNILDVGNFKWHSLRNEGLSCAVFDRSRGWVAYYWNLGDSGSDGRVVVVSGETTSPKILDDYLTSFRQERDEEIAEREAGLRVE